MSRSNAKPGRRVVHNTIDGDDGGALSGRVKEVIEADDQQLIVASYPGEEKPVAFDAREMQSLITVPVLSRGPVITHTRHLWQLAFRFFSRNKSHRSVTGA